MKLNLVLKLLAIAIAICSYANLLPAVATAAACDNSSIKSDVECGTAGPAGVPVPANTTTSINDTILVAVNLFSGIIGIIAVIMIMMAGFRYITSNGKQESVAGAKSTFTYAVIGLVIVALAQVIARFVLNRATQK